MAKRTVSLLLLLSAALWLGGCAGRYTPFTLAEREAFDAFLPRVQFYVSHRIVLSRVTTEESRALSERSHTLRVARDQYVEKIFIEPRTPGVLQRIEGATLHVQFEPPPDAPQRTLPFTATEIYGEGAPPETVVYAFTRDRLTYDGREYRVSFEEASTPVTRRDDAVYPGPLAQEGDVPYIRRERFPMLLIRPTEEERRIREEERRLPGLRVSRTE